MSSPELTGLAERAQARLDAGNIAEAKSLFIELCSAEPDNAEAWLMAGALHGETGSPEDAISCLERALRVAPDYPEAHLTLAHLQKARGAMDACYDSAKRAAELDTDYAEAWAFLGALCCDLERFDEAERVGRETIKRWPDSVQAYVSLATALCNLGREGEAEPLVRTAMTLEGGEHPMVSALLGRILLSRGDYEQAEQLIQAALAAIPGDVALKLNLANIRLGQGRGDEAIAMFRSVTDQAPQAADAWAGLGHALHLAASQGKSSLGPAEEAYRKAIALKPENLPPVLNLALLQEVNGKFAEATETLRNILARRPGQLDAIGSLAGILEKQGKVDEAIQTLEPVLMSTQRNVYVAQAFQRLCKKMGRCEEAAQYLEDVLAGLPGRSEFKAMIHFSLGSLYDGEKQYDRAFKQFEEGNNAKAQGYNPDEYTSKIDEIIRKYSQEFISSLPVSSNRSELPVFIVGMPRSGTSLVERVLSSHSSVFGAGELRYVHDLTDEVAALAGEGQRFPAGAERLTQADIDRLSEKYLREVGSMASGEDRVTDKLPHNFMHIGIIRALFPEARIIHCVRDARDTCLSCYSQNFFGYHPYSTKLEYLGRHYRDYERLMNHWRSLEIPMLEVPYEELVENTEEWARKLVEYCGLDWEDQCLRYYESDQFTRTASYDQVRQPIYKSGMGRWKNYESHLSPLFDIIGK